MFTKHHVRTIKRYKFIEKHDSEHDREKSTRRLEINLGRTRRYNLWTEPKRSRHTTAERNVITENEFELFGTSLSRFRYLSRRPAKGVSQDDLRLFLRPPVSKPLGATFTPRKKTHTEWTKGKRRKINDFWHRKINWSFFSLALPAQLISPSLPAFEWWLCICIQFFLPSRAELKPLVKSEGKNNFSTSLKWLRDGNFCASTHPSESPGSEWLMMPRSILIQ